MQLTDLIEGFLLDCRARRLAQSTIKKVYEPNLVELAEYLDNPQIENIKTVHLRRFLVNVESRDVSAWTLDSYIRVIKRLFNWSIEEEILTHNPGEKLKHPRLPKPDVRVFTPAEIKHLLKTAKAMSYRDYAIVLLMLDSGIRRGELSHLKLNDVNPFNGIIEIEVAKMDKVRSVKIGNKCKKVLWQWVNQHRESSTDYLFVSFRGGGQLTGSAICQMFSRLSKKSGLHVHAHKLRHCFATYFAQKTPNALLLSGMLGHETLDMSKWYVHKASTSASNITNSPMDDLLGE